MDRNKTFPGFFVGCIESLSARRAWIEIGDYVQYSYNNNVALRKESVDRNYYADKDADWVRGRSPQGERG